MSAQPMPFREGGRAGWLAEDPAQFEFECPPRVIEFLGVQVQESQIRAQSWWAAA